MGYSIIFPDRLAPRSHAQIYHCTAWHARTHRSSAEIVEEPVLLVRRAGCGATGAWRHGASGASRGRGRVRPRGLRAMRVAASSTAAAEGSLTGSRRRVGWGSAPGDDSPTCELFFSRWVSLTRRVYDGVGGVESAVPAMGLGDGSVRARGQIARVARAPSTRCPRQNLAVRCGGGCATVWLF